ncbi:MAG: protein kinase [Myxococcales bacterium]
MKAGTRLGRYALIEQVSEGFPGPRWAALGDGGEEDLYSARLIDTARLDDPDAVHRLAAAAFWAVDIRHPNLEAAAEVVATGGQLALLSTYVEGETLRAALRRAHRDRIPFTPDIALRVALDLLAGLAAIDRAASAEADPSMLRYAAGAPGPDGVLLGLDGTVRLLDVGVGAVASAEAAWTHDPVRAGYHAPERFAGQMLDARSDVFSVGVMLWEMLALEHLFKGLRSEKVAQALWSQEIPPLETRVRAPLPRGLSEVVHRALEREPEARFDDHQALADALQALDVTPASPYELADFVYRVGGRRSAERRARLGTEP